MIKRYAVLLFAVALVLVAAPIFATTTCQLVNGPGPLVAEQYQCITSGPTASSNFTYYGPSQDSMCYLYPSNGLYKSLGAYGSGYGDWSVISPDSDAYFSVKIILDLNNTHSHSGDRVGVLVYDDDNYTVETLGTIDGAGGDICSGTYTFNVYRPGWVSRHLRLSIQPWFQDYDANSKVGFVSFSVFDRQVW
jgi:hypothetical protein